MQTEAPHYYNFEISIDGRGGLQFSLEGKKIIYEILSSFIIQITVLLLLSIMKAKAIKSLVVLSLIKKATYGW